MTYQDFKNLLKRETLPKQDYYSHLVSFREDILKDIFDRNQGVVARDLGLTPSKLSYITQILKSIPDDPLVSYSIILNKLNSNLATIKSILQEIKDPKLFTNEQIIEAINNVRLSLMEINSSLQSNKETK